MFAPGDLVRPVQVPYRFSGGLWSESALTKCCIVLAVGKRPSGIGFDDDVLAFWPDGHAFRAPADSYELVQECPP